MKKFIVVFALIALSVSVFSNPIMLPPVISELYWDENGDWSIELVFNDDLDYYSNLDELSLVCNNDTSVFVSGIPIVFGQPMVVSSDDLVSPFDIPIDSGFVYLMDNEYQNPLGWGMMFGHYDGSRISSASYGQSVVYQRFFLQDVLEETYWLVKESTHSIGSLPFTCQTRANISGTVLDAVLTPVPEASIKYTFGSSNENAYSPSIPVLITDENGEFSTDQMFSKEYAIMIFVEDQRELITFVNVEPDSANNYKFLLDSLYVGLTKINDVKPSVSMTALPNPFNRHLDIHIQTNSNTIVKSPAVKLFDLNGNLIRKTDIHSPYLNNVDVHWELMNESEMKPGLYLLVLEVEGEFVATQKLVFQQ
jgi:hypothetical protein